MRYFTDSILLLLYSTLTFFYVPADQALVFALLFAVILCCITYLCRVCKTESCSHNSLPVLKPAGNIIPVLAGSYVIFGLCSLWFSDLLLFFPLLLYQTLSAGLFPLAVAALPLWGFLVFQINRFPGSSLSAWDFWFRSLIFSLALCRKISGSLPGFSSNPG